MNRKFKIRKVINRQVSIEPIKICMDLFLDTNKKMNNTPISMIQFITIINVLDNDIIIIEETPKVIPRFQNIFPIMPPIPIRGSFFLIDL